MTRLLLCLYRVGVDSASGQISDLVRNVYSISTAVTQWCAYRHYGHLVLKVNSKRGDASYCHRLLLETLVFPTRLLCNLCSLVELLILLIYLLLGLIVSIQMRNQKCRVGIYGKSRVSISSPWGFLCKRWLLTPRARHARGWIEAGEKEREKEKEKRGKEKRPARVRRLLDVSAYRRILARSLVSLTDFFRNDVMCESS